MLLEMYLFTQKGIDALIYRFYNEIRPLMPFLKEALNIMGDDCFTSNVFSTFSNLLRHSNIYLSTLEEYKII